MHNLNPREPIDASIGYLVNWERSVHSGFDWVVAAEGTSDDPFLSVVGAVNGGVDPVCII